MLHAGDSGPGGFLGHYVVLTGYDFATNEVAYLDPALSLPVGDGRVSPDDLDVARKSFGTDEDLIRIPLK